MNKRIRRIKRGDLYFANLDTGIGSEQNGYRPVVIIQNNTGNRFSPTVIIAVLSSKTDTKPNLPTHYKIGPGNGLQRQSVVLAEQIYTIDKRRLETYIGHLSKAQMVPLDLALAISIGLSRANSDFQICVPGQSNSNKE